MSRRFPFPSLGNTRAIKYRFAMTMIALLEMHVTHMNSMGDIKYSRESKL